MILFLIFFKLREASHQTVSGIYLFALSCNSGAGPGKGVINYLLTLPASGAMRTLLTRARLRLKRSRTYELDELDCNILFIPLRRRAVSKIGGARMKVSSKIKRERERERELR